MKKLLTLVLAAGASLTLNAQKLNIGYAYPAGGQRGSTFEVTVGGQNLSSVTGVAFSGTGIKGEIIEPAQRKGRRNRAIGEQDNPQIGERVKLRITIDPKAELGMRDLRLTTGTGYSNRVFFNVSQLREVNEVSPNNTLKLATNYGSIPLTINGQILPGERDFLSFEAKEGVTLVCRVQARVLVPYLADAVPGWFQAVLTLYDSQGKEVAYNDDWRYDPDPLIICKLPKDDVYTLQINDAIWRGREDFVYRIAVGELPFVTSIFPLGGPADKKTKVTLDGVNLPTKELTVKPPKGFTGNMSITVKDRKGIYSNPVLFEVGKYNEVFNTAKSPTAGKAATILLNDGDVVNGLIGALRQEDWYAVDAKRNENWVFNVMARRLGSPIDAKLSLLNDKGNVIRSVDDTEDLGESMQTHYADPVMKFSFQKAGRYYIRLTDTEGHYGEDFGYRLHAGKFEPEFDLRIDPSSIIIPQGGSAPIKINALRKLEFNGEITINVKGLPPGYKLSNNVLGRGEKTLLMTITAPKDAKVEPLNLTFTGAAIGLSGEKIVRDALPAESMMQAFYITHLIPTNDFKANIEAAIPVRVTPVVEDGKPITINRKGATDVKIKLEYDEKTFDQPINVIIYSGGGMLKMAAVAFEPGQKEGVGHIEFTDRQGLRSQKEVTLVFVAQVKAAQAGKTLGKSKDNIQNASITAYSPGITIVIPPASKEELDAIQSEKEARRRANQQ